MRQLDKHSDNAAHFLDNAGQYAALTSNLTGSDNMRDMGNRLVKQSAKIADVRNSELANKARYDFLKNP